MELPKCQTCLYWQPIESYSFGSLAQCRLYPPKSKDSGPDRFPHTHAEDGCGQHKLDPDCELGRIKCNGELQDG